MTETSAAVAKPTDAKDKVVWSESDIAVYVSESRAASGLPPTVEDETALRQVAALIAIGTKSATKRRASR